MKRPIAIVVVLAVLVAGVLYTRNARNPALDVPPAPSASTAPAAPAPEADTIVGATLLEGLGNHHFAVTTGKPEAQRWFDQGLMLAYGFNHDAAERSFLRATQIDPQCAMCWWGAALVLGPHVNAAMDPANNDHAWSRLQKAVNLASKATPREQGYITALTSRYAEKPGEDRKPLDTAYAAAMGKLAAQYPDDLDAAVMHAESMMDLQPWDYYDAQQRPKGNTAEIVSTLESVLKRNADHPGALHLYVHAVEASANPERGVAAADRLRTLIPGSGHLVHMPAHIYSRVGRWHDAVLANQVAIKADDNYLAICRGNTKGVYPLGYVPHNHHFLWFAASMEGNRAIAKAAAEQTATRTNLPDLMRQPGFAGLQNYWMTPWFYRVRFGQWDEIAGKPNPAPDLPYVTAIWNYAEGMAAASRGDLAGADKHMADLARIASDPALEKLTVWDRYPLSYSARIAAHSLRAELAAARDDRKSAIAELREAVKIEDGIPYDEPPGWHSPVRQSLGALLLDAGDAAGAEAVYREELARNPDNGWSLFGLSRALRAQDKEAEAAKVDARFRQAWQHADVTLASSRV
jgi:tetratricopeptide (TPR) repeat protein